MKLSLYLASIIYQLEKDIRGDDELELKQLQWSTLMEATNNFTDTNILEKMVLAMFTR